MSSKIKLNEILDFIREYTLIGPSENLFIENAKKIEDADENSIVWISPLKINKKDLIRNTKAKVIICDIQDAISEISKTFICVNNPKLVFARIIKKFFKKELEFGIHPSAILHNEATLANDIYIGPFSYIGRSIIGSGTIIYGNCFIYDNVRIGKNVVIHAGTVIGADGFGYIKNEKDEFEHFPHIGGVIIEDDVEIGANTCIDRGTLGDTIIKKGTKIDNLVHIAHNVEVGEYCLIIANSMIGGSTKIGSHSWVAPSSSILNNINIGKNVTIGMGAVVVKPVSDNLTVAGVPARPIEEFIKIQNKLKDLK